MFAGVTLALAAGALGLSSGPGHGGAAWSSLHLQQHGGIVGEGLYRLTAPLVQDLGVAILVVFLLLVGTILLTGASLATALRATGNGLLDTTRMVRRIGTPPRVGADPRRELLRDLPGEELLPPEPDPRELIVRATHVEAPSRDWLEEEPDQAELDRAQELLGMLPEPPEAGAERRRGRGAARARSDPG